MTLYCDTSLLVTALTNEAGAERIQDWLAGQPPDLLSISDWVTAEVSAALSIKIRTGQITVQKRAAALSMFAQYATETFKKFRVSPRHFRMAAQFADQYATGLRAGDALHLAICASHGATLCTLDRRLLAAGPVLGVKTLAP